MRCKPLCTVRRFEVRLRVRVCAVVGIGIVGGMLPVPGGMTAAAAEETAETEGIRTAPALTLPFPGFERGDFRWKIGPPVVERPRDDAETTYFSIKDPSVVFFGERWHLFCTVRARPRTHQVEYLSLRDWRDRKPQRTFLDIVDGYYCAPQVFYFRPHRKWYLLYQTVMPDRKPQLQPAFSTNDRVDAPSAWSPPQPLFETSPDNVERWIDFWIICDEERAYLFFTSLDGRFWRASTLLEDFPGGWSRPVIALQADIFEAAHVYRLRQAEAYLAIIEAQGGGRRYYKAFLSDSLDGHWRPLAAERDHPFLGPSNVEFEGEPWCQSFSHGELLRSGYDQRMEVDAQAGLTMLFQGVGDAEMAGKAYGEIPWRLGLAVQRR
ncbi:MAG: hypothetical protein GYA33_07070 [Thermogutta sp.]|nr:hypothetical protein [Thermogutta sp.]